MLFMRPRLFLYPNIILYSADFYCLYALDYDKQNLKKILSCVSTKTRIVLYFNLLIILLFVYLRI